MPGAFGDAFRAIDSLPGVTPMASGLPFFFVRGAPPGSTGYFLDGIRLPVLFHLGAGPSIVHPGLIDHVDFYPAAAPAIYGRASGGIVAAETRRPEGHARGEANLRLLDAGALVESPLPKGMGSALAAGRFGYPGLLLPLFAPNTRLSYWDYQLRGTLNLSDHDTLTVFALGSYDYLGRRTRQRPSGTGSPTVDDPVGFGETERRDLETRTIFETDVSRIEAKHEHRDAGTLVREAFVLGRDTTALGLRDRVETDLLSGRVDVERRLSDAIAVTGGLDVAYQRYAVRAEGSPIPSPEFEALFPARDELVLGGRIDATYTLRDRVRITAGLRVDRYSAYRIEDVGYALSPDPLPGTRLSVEPRLSARVAVVPRVTFVSTAGIAGQPPRFALPLPGLTIGRLGEGLERAVQASEGLEWALPFALTVTTTVFASRTVGLADFFAACPGGRGAFTDGNACSGRSGGSAFGFELYVKRAFGEKLTGFLSYTLSRSTRTIPITVFGSGPRALPPRQARARGRKGHRRVRLRSHARPLDGPRVRVRERVPRRRQARRVLGGARTPDRLHLEDPEQRRPREQQAAPAGARALAAEVPRLVARDGPEGSSTSYDVYLRTAVSVDPKGWAHFDYVKMPDYRWGIFLTPPERRAAPSASASTRGSPPGTRCPASTAAPSAASS
jgi:hypothetical protein